MTQFTPLPFSILTALFLAMVGLVSSHPAQTTTVRPPQSIQTAINAAQPWTTIVVKAGTYAEQLLITKDGISLVGEKGTKLVPPTPLVQNFCSGTSGPDTVAGICVVGQNVDLYPWPGTEHQKVKTVGQRVKGVSIKGFEVNGFPGENIALYGAEDASIKDNKLVDGLVYGYLAAGSKNTDARGNKVISTGLSQIGLRYIAMCSDNIAGATVWANDIDGYAIALCVQTNGANIQHNHVTNACYGVFVDPGVDGAIIRHNTIGPSNPDCLPYFGNSTSGIVIFGGTNASVEHNEVTGQTVGATRTLTNFGAGIGVYDDIPEDGKGPNYIASGNNIIRNDVTNNDIDLAGYASGTGNVYKKNTCSNPAGSVPESGCE